MELTLEQTIEQADRLRDEFAARTASVATHPRGTTFSEMLFLWAAVIRAGLKPRQVLESGRAAGVSTELLSRCFPETPIVSFDTDVDGEDCQASLKRLGPVPNIACLFGDARAALPAIALPGDVVLLDGPKQLRAMKLALRLMAAHRVAMVFIHDCTPGTPIRRFLERRVPHAFFADDPAWFRRFCDLDPHLSDEERAAWQDPKRPDPAPSYGGSLACVPGGPGFPSAALRVQAVLARMWR